MVDEELEVTDEKPKKLSPNKKKIMVGAIAVVVIVIFAAIFLVSEDGLNDNGNDTNHAPSANGGEPERTVYVGEEVKFDASNSSDVDGDELTYSWDFDGEVKKKVEVTYIFNVAKLWYVNLTVNDGKLSDVCTVKVTVKVNPELTAPTVELSMKGVHDPILHTQKYIITVTSANHAELLDNFTFALIDDDTSDVIVKMEVKDVVGTQGNITFTDTPPQINRMDTLDSFTVTPEETTLDVADGDMFVLYYKLEGEEVKVAEVELETTGLP